MVYVFGGTLKIAHKKKSSTVHVDAGLVCNECYAEIKTQSWAPFTLISKCLMKTVRHQRVDRDTHCRMMRGCVGIQICPLFELQSPSTHFISQWH